MTFNLYELGGFLASRKSAASLRANIEAELRSGTVVMNLAGVESLSESFADELFGVLAQEYSFEGLFSRLKIVDASDSVVASIVQAIRYRLEREGVWADPAVARLAAVNALKGRQLTAG